MSEQTIERTECAVCGKHGYWGHRFDDDHPAHSYKPVQRRYVREAENHDAGIEAMGEVWVKLRTRDGLFGSVGLLNEASCRRLIERYLAAAFPACGMSPVRRNDEHETENEG